MQQSDIFHDLVIFGAEVKGISKPFLVGNLAMYPAYDIRKALAGFDEDTILLAARCGAIFSKYRESVHSHTAFFSLHIEDLALLPYRLYKPGWILAAPVSPGLATFVPKVYKSLYMPTEERVYPPEKFFIQEADIPKIREVYEKLSHVPDGYLESPVERFSHSYNYIVERNLGSCLADLTSVLESVISRQGDSNQHTMCLRTALLIGNSLYDRIEIQKRLKTLYEVRGMIGDRHGTPEEYYQSFLVVEDAQNLARAVLAAVVGILGVPPSERSSFLPETMEQVIDNYLFQSLRRDPR
jgi:hypothetical protein